MAKAYDPDKRAYIVCGEEDYLRKRAVDEIADACGVSLSELNVSHFSSKADENDIVNACETLPMMSEARLVVVEGNELLKGAKCAAARLIGYIGKIPGFCTLIINSAEAHKSNGLYKAVKERGKIVECGRPKRADYPKFCAEIAAAYGVKITPGACAELASRYAELYMVESEIAKISSVSDKITEEDVGKYASSSLEYDVFALNKLFLEGRVDEALSLYRVVFTAENKSPFRILARVSGKFRDMLKARAMLDAHYAQKDIERVLGGYYFARDALMGAKRFTAPKLRENIVLLADLSQNIISGRADMFRATELALVKAYEADV